MFIAPGRKTPAFTLLEVTLAVAILALMAVAIYRFVQTNVIAMQVSGAARARDGLDEGLHRFLTQELQSLPPGVGALTGEAVKVNNLDRDELTWICSAGPGVLTRYASGDYRVSLRLQKHDSKSPHLDLGLLRRPKEDPAVSSPNETWVRLLENVTGLQVRYFDPRLNTWVQRWTDTVTLPRLVKLNITRADATLPTEMIVPLGRTPL